MRKALACGCERLKYLTVCHRDDRWVTQLHQQGVLLDFPSGSMRVYIDVVPEYASFAFVDITYEKTGAIESYSIEFWDDKETLFSRAPEGMSNYVKIGRSSFYKGFTAVAPFCKELYAEIVSVAANRSFISRREAIKANYDII